MPLDTTGSFTLVGDELPPDAFAVSYRANEGVSELYDVRVEFYTLDPTFDVKTLLRKKACLVVADDSGAIRYFDGIVDRAEFLDFSSTRFHHAIRLRPAMAALQHREDCRIFQEKSIIAICQEIFQEAGFADKVEWKYTQTYPPREFVVQYRESSFDFVSRLFEEHGLFYWFGHSSDGHKMVISDDPGAFAAQDELAPVVFALTQGFGGEPLPRFLRKRGIRPAFGRVRSFDFEKPDVPPVQIQPATDVFPLEVYEFPAKFTKPDEGKLLVKALISSARRDADVVEGQSRAIGLRCGVPFSVQGGAEEDVNGEFVVTRLVTRGSQHLENQGSVVCENHFEGIPKDSPWAPERKTPKPVIRGIQTAVVTGSSKQEQALHVDKYGRIKVKFFWDRVGQEDHTSSCWIRTNQIAMGGTMILPRVGWEVSVAFLDGDPDRPLVLGRVYNAEKTPPYALPGTKTSGSLKSMSSPGAGGHNEIKMGDSGGSQGFDIHAQKDFNVTIEHDKSETIGVDEEHFVSVNESISVGADDKTSVGADQAITIGADLSDKIDGSQTISVGGNDVTNTISNYVEKVGGSRTYKVGGNATIICNGVQQHATGDFTRNVGSLHMNGCIASINEKIGGNFKLDVGAVTVHIVNGSHGETVGGSKNQTSIAAELHMTKGGLAFEAAGSTTQLVGGLHYNKLDGDYVVKAPMITLLGAVGVFKGGSTDFKLGGGPVTVKASKIAVTGALVVKMGASLKMGSG